jgi:uncharacterized membrane protein HdeD (DUF308 family)
MDQSQILLGRESVFLHMTTIEEHEHPRRHGRHFLVVAGALIGLGAGLIAGHPLPGILIGLGLGFIAQGFLKPVEGTAPDSAAPSCSHGSRWISVVIGLFIIIVGFAIIWAPRNFWPYIIGIFLIVLGIMVAAKRLGKGR